MTQTIPATVNLERVMQVECIVVAMFDPFRTCLVMLYVRRLPDIVLYRVLRRRFGTDDPQQTLIEARHRVALALDGGARPRSPVPSYLFYLPEHV